MGQAPDGETGEDDGVTLDLDVLKSLEKRAETTPAPADDAPSTETASESASTEVPDRLVVPFDGAASELSENARTSLVTLAGLLKKSRLRVTIVSYATAGGERSENAARRLALQRAINLRHFLVAEGVDGTRINLKPEGAAASEDGPAGRAEIIIEDG